MAHKAEPDGGAHKRHALEMAGQQAGLLRIQPNPPPDQPLNDREMTPRLPGCDTLQIVGRTGRPEPGVDTQQGPAGPLRDGPQLTRKRERLQFCINRSNFFQFARRAMRPHQGGSVAPRPTVTELALDEVQQGLGILHIGIGKERLQSPRSRKATAGEKAVTVLQRSQQGSRVGHAGFFLAEASPEYKLA